MAELAQQLTYSPADKRQGQLAAAYELFPQIDPERHYPWEFVQFRITGYRPPELVEHSISGTDLRADLAYLIDFLSRTLALPAAEAGEPVLPLEEMTRRFSVSTKTIQRWRRQGLLAGRYVFADGRQRLGFRESAVQQFAAAQAVRLPPAAAFTQLSPRHKKLILRAAHRLARRGQSLMAISRHLARHLERSAETVRYTIRQHDRRHPEQAVFPNMTDPISAVDRAYIIDLFDRGINVAALARRYNRSRSSIYRVVSQTRAARLKRVVIEFVPNPLFLHPEADQIILEVLPRQARAHATVAPETAEPPELSPDLEIDAFRRMNYLKCRARHLQEQLNIYGARSTDLAEIEGLLHQAQALKNQLVQANLGVAVQVARKHQRPGVALAELISDANLWLLRAVERFDFARGVKFATYASYSIMKNFARRHKPQISRRPQRLVTGQETLLEQLDDRQTLSASDQLHATFLQDELRQGLSGLAPRERQVLLAHYGLEVGGAPQSLAELGRHLGLTKTRVRQIETRALRKLRRLIEDRRTTTPPPA